MTSRFQVPVLWDVESRLSGTDAVCASHCFSAVCSQMSSYKWDKFPLVRLWGQVLGWRSAPTLSLAVGKAVPQGNLPLAEIIPAPCLAFVSLEIVSAYFKISFKPFKLALY